MLHTLKNEWLSYSVNEKGLVCSVYNVKKEHEYCRAPGELFRLLYQIGDFDERPVMTSDQSGAEITVSGDRMQICYPTLNGPDGVLDIRLTYTLTLGENRLSVTASVENRSQVNVMELQTAAFAGIRALDGDCAKDSLLVPRPMGQRIHDPAHADFFRYSKLVTRKYDRPEQRHSDLDIPYPAPSCMQWFCLTNDRETVYIGNHDVKHRMICMHTERRMSDNTLRLGINQYPFLYPGEDWETPPVVYAVLDGDWHAAARFYRRWMEEEYGWKAPEKPDWAKEFQGWLRCIFRTQSGEFNFRFTDIPRLFDQVQAMGLNTLFVLGWPKAGFGHYRPDYVLDPQYADDFKKGVEYVHAKGGKLFMFVSYLAVDKKSRYYREENGEAVLVKDIWGDDVRFSETYGADGTYRKMMNLAHSQCCACSGSDQWHRKMLKTADYCLSLGADGVLYDLGGFRPLFCCVKGHDHEKPNEARSSKARRYADLRRNIHEKGDRIIMQEHCVDIYAQHMDIVQPGGGSYVPRNRDLMTEFYRYTFPEVHMVNRNMALDEENMLDNCNYTFMYGLAFDLSIFRCAGTPEDIPNYTAYAAKLIALRKQWAKYFFHGLFIDEDGFTAANGVFRQKAYRAQDGGLGIAVWNDTDGTASETYTNTKTGTVRTVTLQKDQVTFIEL